MLRTLVLFCLALPFVALPQASRLVQVQIEIVADSSNHLNAALQVEPNTNGRDLMDRLFKMEYVDFSKRFVVAIAGFKASSKEKKFWKLEVDGAASQIGITEVVIKQAMRLRWSVSSY